MSYNYNYIFPKKAASIRELSERFFLQDSKKTEVYENAVLLPIKDFKGINMYGFGGAVDEHDNYIEISKQYSRFDSAYDYDTPEYVDKNVVYCGFFVRKWGHFITEVVSRLWYALENDEKIDNYVFLDCLDGNTKITGNYLKFLELLGIADKVVLINKPTRYKSVIFPEDGFDYGKHYTKSFVDMYKYINKKGLELYSGPKYEKVYFSKSKLVSGIFNINIKYIDKYFEKNGYKVFYPEEMSLIDTIGVIQNCKYFCALSSSLAHNQLFGHSNQTMISIEKQAFYNPYQIFVGNITNCEMVFVDACRHIFPVSSAGPFLFDYTDYLDRFAKDFGLKPGKPMSNHKYKKMFKKYMAFYFDLNRTLPPDYMYQKFVIDMSREMYNDTIANGKIFNMSLYNRIIFKLRRMLYKWLGPY